MSVESKDTYKATLGGYTLEIQDIDDQFEKAIARYEFPYRDGALLEDMGQKARTVRFRCFFYGSETAYEAHKQLLNDLARQDLWELIHPKYGLMKGCIEHVSIRHDDTQMTAEVDLSFVENLRGLIEPAVYPEVEAAAEGNFVDAQAEQQEEFAKDLRDELGQEADAIVAVDLDPSVPLLEQIADQVNGLSIPAQAYLREVDTLLTGLGGTLSQFAQPVTSLLSTIEYGIALPGVLVGSIARCVERYAVLYESLKDSPVSFVTSLRVAFAALADSAPAGLKKQVLIASSVRCGLELAYIYKDDEGLRNVVRKAEKVSSFDLLGNYVRPETAGAIMTLDDIEKTLAGTREMIQEAVDQARAMQSLKNMARDLFVHVNQIKIEREKIVTVEIEPEMPLHLICLKYGLPYNYAERVQSLNRVPNPSFTEGDISIYAR